MTLVRDLLLSSAARGLEYIQWVSCIQLTKPPVRNLSGAQHVLAVTIGQDGDFFPKGEVRGGLLRSLAVGKALLISYTN